MGTYGILFEHIWSFYRVPMELLLELIWSFYRASMELFLEHIWSIYWAPIGRLSDTDDTNRSIIPLLVC